MTTIRIVVNDNHIEYDAFVSFSGVRVEKDWNAEVKGILKAEIARRHLTYKDVVQKLAEHGVTETEANLRNKISRGGFSAAFFVQVLTALGAHTVRLHESE